jgi:predicted enzyme related to lactoylglutathione lyase
MSHPINAYMPAVFVPVQDLKRSIEWYAKLFQRPIVPQPDQDTHGIYIFALEGTEIILDRNTWGSPPTIMFDTDDIHAAHQFCKTKPHTVLTDVFQDEYISVFNMNSHMVCKANRDLGLTATRPANAFLRKISRILVHTDDIDDTTAWYEAFVGKSAGSDPRFSDLPAIPMDRGAHLLIDDNRLSQSSSRYFEQPQLETRTNPIMIMESPDLEAALDHVRSVDGIVREGIEKRMGVTCFQFQDPDGNGYLVVEEADKTAQ